MGFNKTIHYCDKCGKTTISGERFVHICETKDSDKLKTNKILDKNYIQIPKKDIRINGC